VKSNTTSKFPFFTFLRYKFFYEDENDITYLCLGDNLNADIALSFLNDVKKKFLMTYDEKSIHGSYSYQLKGFSEQIKKLVDEYTKNPHTKLDMLKKSLNQTNEILHENVEKIFQRSEKLDLAIQKSSNLSNNSDVYYRNIQKMKLKLKYKKLKYLAIFTIFVLVTGFIIYYIIKN